MSKPYKYTVFLGLPNYPIISVPVESPSRWGEVPDPEGLEWDVPNSMEEHCIREAVRAWNRHSPKQQAISNEDGLPTGEYKWALMEGWQTVFSGNLFHEISAPGTEDRMAEMRGRLRRRVKGPLPQFTDEGNR